VRPPSSCPPSALRRSPPVHLAYISLFAFFLISLQEAPQSLRPRQFALDPNFLRAAAPDASSPVPIKQKQQTVRLSTFVIVIDISSTTSLANDVSLAESSSSAMMTPPRPTRLINDQSPRHARAGVCLFPRLPVYPPVPEMTSPRQPPTSDNDEWPFLSLTSSLILQLRKVPAAQHVKIHPLQQVDDYYELRDSARVYIADLEGERTNEDEMLCYARKLCQVVSLTSPCTPSGSSACPCADSRFPTPPSRGSSGKGPCSRMNEPYMRFLARTPN
jgi:hypothetical protein